MKLKMTSNYFSFSGIRKRGKYIASFFIVNILLELLMPLKAWALTGGPSQPETTSFEPVGTTEMVDLFTGDFNYNIPLFDVGGYPVNISYHGGVSMDQEASWVGLGWNINPGAINRGMRGVPDDFLDEEVHKEMNMKNNTTWALKFNTDLEIFGFIGMKKRNKLLNKNGTVNRRPDQDNSYKQMSKMGQLGKTNIGLGVIYNNYKGLGYSLDFSTEISKTMISEDEYNAKLNEDLDESKSITEENKEKLKNEFENYDNQSKILEEELKKYNIVRVEYSQIKSRLNQIANEKDRINRDASKVLKDKELFDKSILNDKNRIFKEGGMKKLTINYGLNSQEGASLNGSYSYSKKIKDGERESKSISGNIGLGYNSYLGVSSFDAGMSYSKNQNKNDISKKIANQSAYGTGTYLPIGTYSYVPNITMQTLSTSNSFNATIGFDAFGGHPDMRLSGFYNTEELEFNNKTSYAYGYLYEQEIFWKKGKENMLMDFNREKESAVNKNMSHLPMANHTYDVYSVSGQGTGGMYRPHRKTIGVLHDGYSRNRNKRTGMNDFGLELGFGSNFRFGSNFKNKVQKSSTGLWGNSVNGHEEDNELLAYLNYRMSDDKKENKRHKQVYFKAAGEQTPSDNVIGQSWGGKKEVSLRISKTNVGKRNLRFGKVSAILNEKSDAMVQGFTDENPVRSNAITYLTAEESSHYGLGVDPYIISYPLNYWTNYIKHGKISPVSNYKRYGGENGAKPHHISEIITNSGDGMRYVYGLPAYNTMQKDVNFAISQDILAPSSNHKSRTLRKEMPEKGLVEYNNYYQDNTVNNERGVDHYFNSTTLPAYAHSYLLTGVLSPDYADVTGDGITDDDYGSAVKFNYYKTPGQYQWRTPYERDQANLDEGFITDNSDNKASYVYGKKEQWYLQSMESKTHIAEFKLSKRKDAHGVIDENGGLSTSNENSSMKLDSIVIYSKYDLLVNGSNAVPVKTIVFQYDYSLCPGVPNNENGGGKLTLKSIYFTYGNSGKGSLNPYRFTYSNFNPAYSHVHYDRWGNYKYANEKLPNRYFPYTDYETSRDTMDKYATAWNLTQVELPSGGKINVEYEADDYAFVQDRKAMEMHKITGASHQLDYEYINMTSKLLKTSISVKKLNQSAVIKSNLYDKGKNNNYLYFPLSEPPSSIPDDKQNYFIDRYLRDEKGEYMDYIYYRFKVNMDPRGQGANNYEYVSGYAKIDIWECGITDDKKFGYVKVREVSQGDAGLTKCNPIAKQAWQMGMQNLRKVIYPGSDLSQVGEDGDRQSAIVGLKNAFTTSLNMFTGPYQNLRWKEIAKNFEVGKSYIRLYNANGKKVGGGCRVKRITINDNWNTMDNTQSSGQYGQEYDYITKEDIHNGKGEVISSGVASYEPFVGNDENPFRRPAFYHTNRFMFPDLNEYHEEPFGESFFPSPTVGYSRVVVRNIPKPGTVATSTGKVVHQFYTAREFPVITTNTPLKFITNGGGNSEDNKKNKLGKAAKKFTKSLKTMFNVVKRDYLTATQGYSIVLNDMHGKPRSTAIYSSLDESSDPIERQFTGRLLSGSEYKYKTENSIKVDDFGKVFQRGDSSFLKPVPAGSRLSNTVWVMKENGQLIEREIATSYDVAVDTRESKSHQRHAGIDFNLENFLIMSVPCPYPKYLVTQNLYQGAVVTKVIQQYGIMEETVAYDHSSIVKTKNLVWDEQTGQVILASTTNEFDDPIYNYTYPAHLVYEGMGPAYKNIDFETELTIQGSGEVNKTLLPEEAKTKFYPGDELLMRKNSTVQKGWILKADIDSFNMTYKRLQVIDNNGQPIAKGTWQVRVIRSGRKNLAATPVGAITTMSKNIFKNGVNENRLVLNEEVVQSSAAVFTDKWQGYMHKGSYLTKECDTFYLDIANIHSLLKGMVAGPNSEQYRYSTNPSNTPPSINNISTYNEEIKKVMDMHVAKIAKVRCGTPYYSIGNYYFAASSGTDSNNFQFKAKIKCPGEENFSLVNLTCEVGLTPGAGCTNIPIRTADSISNIITRTGTQITFNVYKGGSSCTYTMDFPNNCFYEIICKSVPNCDYVAGRIINPFTNNVQGIWRQKEAYAFNSSRKYEKKGSDNTNIRKDGMIENYQPFWNFYTNTNYAGLERNKAAGTNKWVSTGQATMYSPEGNGLEEKDAMNIYSSQLFGYNHKLVTAQAGNARHRQIAFDNFEDYMSPEIGCSKQEDHFNFKKGLYFISRNQNTYSNLNNEVILRTFSLPLMQSKDAFIVKDTSHSGVYSMCVKQGKTHSSVRRLDYTDLAFANENDSFYRIKSLDRLIIPFAPTPGKYVVSAWVMEKHSDMNSVNTYENAYLNVKVYNGGTAVVNQNIKADGLIIENWQRIDGVITIPTGADSIKVSLVNDGEVRAFFDDFRMHPFDAKMAGHVYHSVHLKVLAELDDNNYATFYEYDDEGSLVRVKRETEKGIITIQESRKSIKKKTP